MTITQKELHKLVTYNPENGEVRFKHRPQSYFNSFASYKRWNGRFEGKLVGCKAWFENRNCYYSARIGGFKEQLHRFIWIYVYGSLPDKYIDHINGDGLDNRICNLREADHYINGMNTRLPKTNTSGRIGVSFNKEKQRWESYITAKGKRINLGYSDSLIDAVAKRIAAEKHYGFHENHGRS